MSSLLYEVDRLYEGCVTDPERWGDQAFADWTDGVASTNALDRDSAKAIRRCVNAARKLQRFWVDRSMANAPDSWRSRVDLALGARAWRPQLELAEHVLATDPSEEVFVVVADLFPLVRNQPYLDGISYEEWSAPSR